MAPSGTPALQRRRAECSLCIVAIIDCVATSLQALDAGLAADLHKQLAGIVTKHAYTQVSVSARAGRPAVASDGATTVSLSKLRFDSAVCKPGTGFLLGFSFIEPCITISTAYHFLRGLCTQCSRGLLPPLQVIAAACQCYCNLARLQPALAGDVSLLASLVLASVTRQLAALRAGNVAAAPAAIAKPLFVLGSLCRHGADLLDRIAGADGQQDSGGCVRRWHPGRRAQLLVA